MPVDLHQEDLGFLLRMMYSSLTMIRYWPGKVSIGGGGADINPLKSQKGMLIGLRPDSQRYFDYHHTAIDLIDAVNKRELQMGAAAMTSLVYLIDNYGLK